MDRDGGGIFRDVGVWEVWGIGIVCDNADTDIFLWRLDIVRF